MDWDPTTDEIALTNPYSYFHKLFEPLLKALLLRFKNGASKDPMFSRTSPQDGFDWNALEAEVCIGFWKLADQLFTTNGR